MPSSVATCVFVAFILWLFSRDAKRRNKVSVALWIPLTWAFIIGSKPISMWLGINHDLGSTDYVEDSILDKGLFLFLIVAGLTVLMRRRANWHSVYLHNKWLFVFFLYLGISVLWSDDPFVAFKRWVKDFGNVVMVLVILSEEDPLEAVRAFLVRCAYLLIPLSVLVVKYYPSISTQYDMWDGRAFCVAITTNKNILGMTLSVCGLSLLWVLLDQRDATQPKDKTASLRYLILMLMTVWLLLKAHSSTALSCTLLGGGILLAMRVPAIRSKVNRLGLYGAGAVFVIVLLQASGLWDMLMAAFVQLAGRDLSFHGRTAIWQALLKQDINPLIGVGYYSFWSKERMQKLSEGYHYLLNEAHNGYLEIYLNSGLIGLFLLFVALGSAAKWIKREVISGATYGALRFAFLAAAAFYAMSEAIFNRLSLLWFVLLLALMRFPHQVTKAIVENKHEELHECADHNPARSGTRACSLV